jgi:hypothetical protein
MTMRKVSVSKPRSLITSTAALVRSMSIVAKVSGEPWMDVKLAERLGGEAACGTGDKMLRHRAGSLPSLHRLTQDSNSAGACTNVCKLFIHLVQCITDGNDVYQYGYCNTHKNEKNIKIIFKKNQTYIMLLQ